MATIQGCATSTECAQIKYITFFKIAHGLRYDCSLAYCIQCCI